MSTPGMFGIAAGIAAFLAGAVQVADQAELRVRNAQAASCARLADDSEVAACYVSRDLPVPPIVAARRCARQSTGTDTAVEACYTSRGLPLPTEE